MSDYPPIVTKAEQIYKLWESGEGDMGELAIGLYDLTAHYKALWDDYFALEAESVRLRVALEYIIERYKSDDETGLVAANMYGAAKAALAVKEKK